MRPVSESPARQQAWRCACEACAASEAAESAYFPMAFDPRHFAATVEDLADALGFCERHGAQLMATDPLRPSAARVFEAVIPRAIALLLDERFGDQKFQQVYFSAEGACPACLYERRVVGRHTARLARQHVIRAGPDDEATIDDRLCVQHFQAVTHGLKPEWRMPVLARFADVMERIEYSLEHPSTAAEQQALDLALGVIVGSASRAAPPRHLELVAAISECPDIDHGLGCSTACPVCMEIERARQRWLATVPLAAAYGLDGWLFFPTCPVHVGAVAEIGESALSGAVCAHAMHVAIGHMHQQLSALARAAETEAEIAAARITRWGRQRRRRNPDPSRPPAPRLARCAACERVAVAELQAVVKLLRMLGSDNAWRRYQAGYGLCMKHHAQVYLLSPRGAIRLRLAEDQRRRLSALQKSLSTWRERALQKDAPPAAMPEERRALHRFCGFG